MTAETKRTKKYAYFIGIDISKNKLDLAVCQEKTFLFHEVIKNEKDAILAFVDRLKGISGFRLSKAVFCMENTGIYGNHILNTLSKTKANIVQDNARKIKNSAGIVRGKDDKADAIMIAEYAWKNRDELVLWAPRSNILMEVSSLLVLRNRLLSVAHVLKTPQDEEKTFINKKAHKKSVETCKATIQAITADLSQIELELRELVNADQKLSRLLEVITSVPFIGFFTAIQIIICTNEFKDINDPKKFACYAGIAPFRKESGMIVRKRRLSQLANKKIKSLLHMCAMSAAYRDEELKVYFQRKLKEGKPKLSVFNAVRYKLILRVFACLKQDRCYIRNYRRQELSASKTEQEFQHDREKNDR